MTETDQLLRDTTDQLLRDTEVASLLALSRSSVWRLAKVGKLPQPVKIGFCAARWKKSEIKAFLDAAL